MPNTAPLVHCWYKDLNSGNVFEVVAIDERQQTIEAQFIDGELTEYDSDSWQELQLSPIEEPEDWRNPFELSNEDYPDPDAAIQPECWDDPLDQFEANIINGLEDDDALSH